MTELSDGTGDDVIRRQLNPERDDPASQLAEVVADLTDDEPLNLTPVYGCIDTLIADLFSSPPPDEADACIAFDYEGYRIRVQQDGTTTLRELSA
ncbi:HalOD1 output domain-containing protein [Natrinema halophilum]|uniref:Halobacterial output domain-containing protein n=1 Tax=Natrinema halophilum TaxID=1699371 RepID=A0A7D5KCZ6_9EURY|nr:HalOD1 output domain-containing protein [Natrinema halophilum]QLG48976.1 hypothetical protein HYG82_08995 [Natrinema halophilum]